MLLIGVIRRTQWTPIRRNISSLRNVTYRNLQLKQTIRISGLRFESTTPKSSTQASQTTPKPSTKFAYPERLCVYHAGTGKVTFLACLKISTLFIFVFFGFVVTPAYYDREGFSPTVLRTTLSALIPLLYVAYTTTPFVSFIHMRLPPFARQSEDMLRRYIRSLSQPQTQTQKPTSTPNLEITTMSFIAKPRISVVNISELRPTKQRMGIVNLVRDTTSENATRPWYKFRAVGAFNAQGNTVKRVPWVWESILGMVEKQRV
ncbi:uncharacterized protein F4822DRAFT_146122 [Hypoxylon trugodes]|uniref:uncharacterized protein n=1 Tax=Hypoxylon trugodes TaxID=326681 RepID=UPI00219E381E|nr:uncharacterized protein F4822DRAFT_146122 [Hypoxylon trugodes]KAI1392908.1 hypothetical protein F4822DRAFT_146122 [Hypoxylon trugodes]